MMMGRHYCFKKIMSWLLLPFALLSLLMVLIAIVPRRPPIIVSSFTVPVDFRARRQQVHHHKVGLVQQPMYCDGSSTSGGGTNDDDGPENHQTTSFQMMQQSASSRRSFILDTTSKITAASLLATIAHSNAVLASDMVASGIGGGGGGAAFLKVLVLGGTGFVGSQVVQILTNQGVTVVATSRNGREGTEAFDVTNEADITKRVQTLARGCSAVISCIGAIGTEVDEVVNGATGLAAVGAKEAGVKKFVYITVAPEVADFARDIDFLQGYMAGKKFSRDAVLQAFGNDAVFIEPTFIYGGGAFELNPPRVASFYGKFIEGLLSSSPIRSVERILSPGIIKIALEPPVPVEAVASAAVAGSLGRTTPGVALDTYDKIKEAGKLVEA